MAPPTRTFAAVGTTATSSSSATFSRAGWRDEMRLEPTKTTALMSLRPLSMPRARPVASMLAIF